MHQNLLIFSETRMIVLFDAIYLDIYPEEFTLLNTNRSPCKVNFLDMTISLHQGKFKHCLQDKHDNFNFAVIYYPFLSGKIPISTFLWCIFITIVKIMSYLQ